MNLVFLAAAHFLGVVVDLETGAADMEATRKLRQARRSEDPARGCGPLDPHTP